MHRGHESDFKIKIIRYFKFKINAIELISYCRVGAKTEAERTDLIQLD